MPQALASKALTDIPDLGLRKRLAVAVIAMKEISDGGRFAFELPVDDTAIEYNIFMAEEMCLDEELINHDIETGLTSGFLRPSFDPSEGKNFVDFSPEALDVSRTYIAGYGSALPERMYSIFELKINATGEVMSPVLILARQCPSHPSLIHQIAPTSREAMGLGPSAVSDMALRIETLRMALKRGSGAVLLAENLTLQSLRQMRANGCMRDIEAVNSGKIMTETGIQHACDNIVETVADIRKRSLTTLEMA